jgi:hypothetical protein
MKPLPNPITEREVKIELQWSADQRTTEALERQSRLMGLDSPTDYLLRAIAAVLVGNEEETIVTDDGRLVCGRHAYCHNGVYHGTSENSASYNGTQE